MKYSSVFLREPELRTFAFCGASQRNLLQFQFGEELLKLRKKLVLTSPTFLQLPVSGNIVVGQNMEILAGELSRELQTRPMLFVGKQLNGSRVIGLDSNELVYLQNILKNDVLFFYDLPTSNSSLLNSPEEIQELIKHDIWDEVVFYFPMEYIDHPLTDGLQKPLKKFRRKYPDLKILAHDLVIDYFVDSRRGIGKLFHRKKETILFLGSVNSTYRENRAIQLANDLYEKGIQHIVLGDVDTNTIIKVYSPEK